MKSWKVQVKSKYGKVAARYTIEATDNLMALLEAQTRFMNDHKEYSVVDCGMWIGENTAQRDLTVEVRGLKLERYFSIEIVK